MGGHPSLWTEFPLQVGGDTFPKIQRLDWVKSVTISLSDAGIESLANTIQAAIDTLPSLGELFILNDKVTYYPYDNHFVSLIQKFLKTDNNKLVRVGSRGMHGNGSSSNQEYACFYYVSSCDTDLTKFLKKTLNGKETWMSIHGLPGAYLSNEILETVCTVSGIQTNLMIDKDMDLRKLRNSAIQHPLAE